MWAWLRLRALNGVVRHGLLARLTGKSFLLACLTRVGLASLAPPPHCLPVFRCCCICCRRRRHRLLLPPQPSHGDVCRTRKSDQSTYAAPESCTVTSAAPWTLAADGASPCRAIAASGSPDTDLLLIVTVEDTKYCTGGTQAYAQLCATDSVGRPLFGHVNFCANALDDPTDPLAVQNYVNTAKHEIGLCAAGWHATFCRIFAKSPFCPDHNACCARRKR